ncbi:hypothetical protein Rvan_1426 [Rhodomicrobium vannielii ATCC 17100]|uniref:Uncharacterized protein n=1 Tax=Rhodomicrobium vannielii (strain ATCC 17100 / DSM 162 / LMG 4299 / NCIMB 10020 / ATH 3.1.1) TaxID=648757 RepID=E3I6N6_RHOVT|nr:hypothetical protein Rvan_1426 [Rhodomicrobium vannielii ATCC 17100]
MEQESHPRVKRAKFQTETLPDWADKLSREAVYCIRSGQTINKSRSSEAVTSRAFMELFGACGMSSHMADRVNELNFDDLLDRLIFLRDGVNRFNKENIPGSLNTVLENWPHFTDALVAVATAYGHSEYLKRPKMLSKIERNAKGNDRQRPASQCHDFDPAIAMICPKSAGWVRASCLPITELWKQRSVSAESGSEGAAAYTCSH